ncbi:hypothetical protein CYLTODRAFT_493679 [Cylindrobasidium torrendii FP15055 ss-10]|uniref:Uncharacterized protein n=1 Tax=Cylindrobasidium torrendii FP15055 ss-10 TaxID=1314674 RepID=A0A0D7AZT9_9AGAR|nr:hypothetical protein CYLTODRAFT_493679 [Cylindrobasidium torrendii FP15055 ss-10]
MASSTDLQSIEDWGNYIGASREGDKPLSTASLQSNVKTLFESVLDSNGQLIGDTSLLRLSFQTWRAILDAEDAGEPSSIPPRMLMVGLDDNYDKAVSLSSLTPTDQQAVLQIAPLAKAYGFDLHLADAELSESGSVSWEVRSSYYGYGRGYGRGGYGRRFRCYYDEDEDDEDMFDDPYGMGYDSDEDPDIDDLDMEDVDESETSLNDIVALDGRPMIYHTCPEELDDVFISGKLIDNVEPEKSFERFEAGSGTLTYSYKTSVLVITPSEDAGDFVTGNICPWACQKLFASISPASTPREADLVQQLLEYLPTAGISPIDRVEAARALRNTADRWNDVDLFVRACRACGLKQCLEAMTVEGMVSACQAFDWGNLSSIFTEVYEQSTSNTARRQLITALLKSSAELDDKNMAEWCHTQSGNALDTIQQLDAHDVPWATAILHSKGDPVAYARDRLFPQLIKVQPQKLSIWASLFSAVLASTRPQAEIQAMAKVVKTTLCTLANAIPAYPLHTPGGIIGYRTFSIDPLDQFIVLCCRYDVPEAMSSIFDRMWQDRGLQQQRVATGGYPPSKYYSAIVNLLSAHASAKPELKPHLHKFHEHAAELLLSDLTNHPTMVLMAIKNTADPISTLKQTFTADRVREIGKNRQTLKLAVEAISQDLRPLTTSSTLKSFEHVLKICLAELIRTFDNKTITQYSYQYSYLYGNGIRPATELIELCFTLKLPVYAGHVLAKFLAVPETNEKAYIQQSLVGILEALPGILRSHNARIDELPWSAFAAEVIKKYTRHVLGAKPPPFAVADSRVRALSCGCGLCSNYLLPILLDSNQSGRITQKGPVRTHIEKRLAAASPWGMKWETSTRGRPYTLVIHKPAAMVATAAWNTKCTEARKILALLGDATAQAKALGDDYDWVTGTMKGTSKPPVDIVAMGQAAKKRAADVADATAQKKARLY